MPNKKALVVAIDDYGGPPNNLPSCIADGNAISRLLQSSYNIRDIHTLFDAKATVGNVERELDWLVSDAKPDDRLVFFYSGHGYTKLTNGVMEEFLVLRDESGKPALWVDDKLVAKTQNIPTGALTVLLDCCFAGGNFKFVFDPTGTAPDAEIAQVKAYQPPAEEQAKAFEALARKPAEDKPTRVTAYRRFGCGTAATMRALSSVFARARQRGVRNGTRRRAKGVVRSIGSATARDERAADFRLPGDRNRRGEHVENRRPLGLHALHVEVRAVAGQPTDGLRGVQSHRREPQDPRLPANTAHPRARQAGDSEEPDVSRHGGEESG